MAKLSAYQKLKQENERLRKQLRVLVLDPNSLDALGIRAMIKTESSLEKSVWAGSAEITCSTGFEGLLKQIT